MGFYFEGQTCPGHGQPCPDHGQPCPGLAQLNLACPRGWGPGVGAGGGGGGGGPGVGEGGGGGGWGRGGGGARPNNIVSDTVKPQSSFWKIFFEGLRYLSLLLRVSLTHINFWSCTVQYACHICYTLYNTGFPIVNFLLRVYGTCPCF